MRVNPLPSKRALLATALILLAIIPVIIFYLACQKHIIKGVAAGAVKG